LGRPVSYAGDDLDQFEKSHAFMGPMVLPYRHMFQFYQEHGLIADPDEVEATAALLGRQPRSLADFATESTAAWEAKAA
jgi:hypothetical protein